MTNWWCLLVQMTERKKRILIMRKLGCIERREGEHMS